MTRPQPGSESSQSNARKTILVVLGLVVVGTLFLLPQFVDEPWFAGDVEVLPEIPRGSAASVAPSTAAELTRFRQQSQSVLAQIVDSRERLETMGVEFWAGADFQQALEIVASGDEFYSYGEYQASLEAFEDARDRLAALEDLGHNKLEESKASALDAIESLNMVVATSASELASAIAADDPEVKALLARVETLEQVAAHIEAGDLAMDQDRFEQAREEYRQAANLDPAHRRAADALANAGRQVTDVTFRRHMSRGFAALEQGDYVGAREAFGQAGRIYPGNDAVSKALAQVNNRESHRSVSRDLTVASEFEAREEWAQALAIYERLLADDPSLSDAKVKLIPARVRAELDERLQKYIDDPLLLSSESGYRSARTTLEDARGIPEPGARLVSQIEALDQLIERANLPVDVVFRSDNLTHVVLYRVADLGRFESTSVKLRPGRYVVAGTRNGYRDVRVEFTVTGQSTRETIDVRCEEPIG